MAGIAFIPLFPGTLGKFGAGGTAGAAGGGSCEPAPGGKLPGGWGMDGGAGMPGKFVGPMPGGKRGGIGGGAEGLPGWDCGPMPGGGPAGAAGNPGGMPEEVWVASLNRTKVLFIGATRVT